MMVGMYTPIQRAAGESTLHLSFIDEIPFLFTLWPNTFVVFKTAPRTQEIHDDICSVGGAEKTKLMRQSVSLFSNSVWMLS